MRPTPAAAGPGFLASLASLASLATTANHGQLGLQIETENSRLRVTLTLGGHEPLELLGTPAVLDAQLPAAIEKYTQLAGVVVPTPAPPPAAAKATPKRTRKAAPKKAAARKRPAVKKSATRRKPAAKKAAPRRAATPSHANGTLPGKPECIADYKNMKARYGAKLTRRLFVDTGKTGRRYEKLWANSWPSFVKEAEGGKSAPAAPAAAPAAKAQTAKPKKGASKTTQKAGGKTAKEDKRPWTVKAGTKTLGVTIFEKKPGDTYSCSAGTFTVRSVEPLTREIHVDPAPAKAAEAKNWDSVFPSKNPVATADPKKPAAPYAIKDADGKTHGATLAQLPIGATWGADERWEVLSVDHEKREYTVKDRQAPAAPAAAEQQAATTEKTS